MGVMHVKGEGYCFLDFPELQNTRIALVFKDEMIIKDGIGHINQSINMIHAAIRVCIGNCTGI